MTDSIDSSSVRFFDTQFRRQAAAGEFGLNPFEARALPHLRGAAIDLGCGLGNLACAAAARGAHVLALDASPAAIESLKSRARAGTLSIEAVRPGGTLVVNVLIEGTTFLGMFDQKAGYCLFGEEELPQALAGWQVLEDFVEQFPASEGIKRFRTMIACRPAAPVSP